VIGSNYDLVFTDNQMTQVHGLLAIRKIREQDQETPIYMVSSSKVGKQAVEFGATGYVDKQDRSTFRHGIEAAVEKHLR
jgi:CheY-like chemotaxis protein